MSDELWKVAQTIAASDVKDDPNYIAAIVRAYGDQRAREAREAALREAANVAFGYGPEVGNAILALKDQPHEP